MPFDLKKLHTTYQAGIQPDAFALPRVYTFTHSDLNGDMFLTVGACVNEKQFSGWYARWMRDEIIASWNFTAGRTSLIVHCHVSGGFVFGTAGMRFKIFQEHLNNVLYALANGDSSIYRNRPALRDSPVFVEYHASQARYQMAEDRGRIGAYLLPSQD